MQKVIRRTAMAEKQAARRLSRKKDKATRDWAKSNRNQANYSRKEVSSQVKEERINRREDWELGPLAPRRDVGSLKDTYGTISSHRLKGSELNHDKKAETLKRVGGRYLNIVAGDRVVLLEGKDKGKIGKIRATDAKRAECTVEGLNMADVAIGKWMITSEDPDQRPFRSLEQPVSFDSVRLVYPLTDPDTGVTRDVIIKELINGKIWHDRQNRTQSWTRLIPGLNIAVPWPKKEPKEHKDFPNDTLRMDVEVKTFVPTLVRPPMPSRVIDELRNKYSIFRTRHDPEFVDAKMREDEDIKAKKELNKKMRTPVQEANRKERKLRKAKGKGTLSADMLERIGRVIANKQQIAMDAAGVSKEESALDPLAA